MIYTLLLLAAAPGPTEVIDAVWPPAMKTDTLAVVVRPADEDWTATLRARLKDRGAVEELVELQPQDTLPITAARELGAEYLLVVDKDVPWRVRLFVVDRGLWQRAPTVHGLELIAHARGPTVSSSPPPADERWREVARLRSPVLSVAACTPGQVWGLERDRLTIFRRGDDGTWTVLAELSFEGQAPARMPVRDPMGRLVCLGQDVVAWGTTDHASGGRARIGQTIEVQDRFPGIPVGRAGDALLLARAHEGVNLWQPTLSRWPADAPTPPIQFEAPLADVVQVGPDLLQINATFGTRFRDVSLGPSAPGASGVPARDDRPAVVVLPSLPKDNKTTLRMVDQAGKAAVGPVDVEGAVRASSLVRSDHGYHLWLGLSLSATDHRVMVRELRR